MEARKIIITIATFLGCLSLISSANAGSGLIKWQSGDTSSDCKATCLGAGMYPVSSGFRWINNDIKYNYVCSYNHHGRGMRPGFNPQGQSECIVGTGGNAYRDRNKECLCNSVPVTITDSPGTNESVIGWVYTSFDDKRDCPRVCADQGWSSVVSGVYIGSEHDGKLYSVCSVDSWDYKAGDTRAGLNLEGEDRCHAGTGGSTVIRDNKKGCLCTTECPSSSGFNYTYDCEMNCAPSDWVRDDYCDDGVFYGGYDYGTDFLCKRYNRDHDACISVACGNGKIYDCSSRCVDSDLTSRWMGDGVCDDGKWGVDLICSEFLYDKGDCN